MKNSNTEFKVGKHSIGYVSDSFRERFGEASFEPRILGTFQKLPRNMTDAEIETELKPGLCELGDVLAFLDNPPESAKDGNWNLFYTPSCVVRVYWYSFDGSWRVDTWKRDDDTWDAGERVFSPATKTQTLEPKPSDASDPLVLGILELTKQVKRVADALEKAGKPAKVERSRKAKRIKKGKKK